MQSLAALLAFLMRYHDDVHAKMNGTKLVHLTDTVKILSKNFFEMRKYKSIGEIAKIFPWTPSV